jgi:uncharacterized protein (TIGR01244 family)
MGLDAPKETRPMNVKRPITAEITIADQPSEAELRGLKQEGYVGVVNLRNDGEPEQPLGVAAEGATVNAAGMDYLHYGVGAAPLSQQGVTSVCDFLEKHAGTGKVLVHCRKGARAAALVLLYQAKLENWAPEEALSKGREMGLEVDGGLRMLVEGYLREHGGRG